MNSMLREVLRNLGSEIVEYLPNLAAGLLLISIGWLLGWLAKRIVIQICVVVRFDRLLRRFRWGAAFSKADVRHAFFNSLGNIAFFLIFLVLLNASFEVLELAALSQLLERVVLFFPRLLLCLLISGLGWIIAGWVAITMQKALTKEEVPRAALIARFSRSVVFLFFAAMALAELGIAREIVVIGFTVTIITLGLLAIVITRLGGEGAVKKVLEKLEED